MPAKRHAMAYCRRPVSKSESSRRLVRPQSLLLSANASQALNYIRRTPHSPDSALDQFVEYMCLKQQGGTCPTPLARQLVANCLHLTQYGVRHGFSLDAQRKHTLSGHVQTCRRLSIRSKVRCRLVVKQTELYGRQTPVRTLQSGGHPTGIQGP